MHGVVVQIVYRPAGITDMTGRERKCVGYQKVAGKMCSPVGVCGFVQLEVCFIMPLIISSAARQQFDL